MSDKLLGLKYEHLVLVHTPFHLLITASPTVATAAAESAGRPIATAQGAIRESVMSNCGAGRGAELGKLRITSDKVRTARTCRKH